MKIEGYFGNIKKANETISKLKSEGFKGAFVDINDHNNNAYSQNGIVGTRDVTSQTEAVLGNSTSAGERGSSPLAAASPMVSGMGRFEEVADINCKVVIEVNDGDKVKAESIIRSMDGTTDDPNARLPKGLENIDEDAYLLRNLKE